MKEGEVLERGETGKLFSSAQHPYTQELLAASNVEARLAQIL
jgi:microcin C transport system ATP-binding protein